MQPLKILVVEDFAPFRRLVCAMLKQQGDCHLIQASDGLDALHKVEGLQPDLIILDVGLPRLNGLEVARRARKLAPAAKIVFVSQESSADVVREAFGLGALGYLQKLFTGSELLPAVQAVLGGTHFVSGRFVHTKLTASQGGFEHEAQLYSDDTILVERLTDLVHSALRTDDAAVVVASEGHRSSLVRKLTYLGVDCASAEAGGQLTLLDAKDTLSKILVDRMPDSGRFAEIIGGVLAKAKSSRPADRSRVTVFGEMVALLWADGCQQATIRLEEFWNWLASKHRFSVRCAYPMKVSHQAENRQLMMSVCSVHSAVHSI